MYFFTVEDWHQNKSGCLAEVASLLGAGPWVVRSSCGQEDTLESASAGAYETVLNVEWDGLENAIETVIGSYGDASLDDEILIQPMLVNVVRSGVAFSHDPNTCSPYRIINWMEGSDTAAVTGGLGGNVWQQAAECSIPVPAKFAPIVSLIDELLSKGREIHQPPNPVNL